MRCLGSPSSVAAAIAQLPDIEGVCLAVGGVEDCCDALWSEERAALSRASEHRAREFSTGRHLARCAMQSLGLEPGPILRQDDRSPRWPPSTLGSITHAGDLAMAAVSHPGAVRGIGIDLERHDRVTGRLHRRIFTQQERAALAGGDPRLPGLAFSAKEAAYKAVHPLVGRFIGFHEAEVDISMDEERLRIRYVGEHEPNRVMEEGVGHFCFFGEYVLTVFVIPR